MTRDDFRFGARVRALRLAAGLTQTELAEAAGISERSVSDLERGLRTHIYPNTARQLARALRVAGDDLPAFLVAARGSVPGVPASPEPLPSTQRSRLPQFQGELVGRDSDLPLLIAVLRDDAAQLVTLVGTGGVGKTRLAVEAARRIGSEFSGGCYFGSLSAIDDAALVPATIAGIVGARVTDDPFGALLDRFGSRPALLLLDTMEHVLDAAPAISALLSACVSLRVLITSRSALNVTGERLLRLKPLALTGPPHTMSPAAQLFLDRARAVAPDMPVSDETRALAESIAAQLDGVPLALELAAARAQHMPLRVLHQSLANRLDSLTGGLLDRTARHRTMRAALDWSHALLEDSARRQLRVSSVFRGGFDVDAAAAVAGPGWADHHGRVIDALGRLVDGSLLVLEHDSAGRGRYHLLDVVRDYARERAVESGETAALRRRHAEYYLTLAERGEAQLRGRGQRDWHARLLLEESNLRAAMAWALELTDGDIAQRFAAALWMFWRWAGFFADGKRWLDAALAMRGGSRETRLRALWGAGWLAYHQGDYARTAASGQDILELALSDDAVSRRNGLTLVSIAALAVDKIDQAIAAAREALVLAESTGPGWLMATSLLNLGTAELAAGDVAVARNLYTRALDEYASLGDVHFRARTLIQLGYCALEDGDRATASGCIDAAVSTTQEIGDLWGIAEGLEAAAVLAADVEPHMAARLAGGAHHIREQIAMNAHPPDARLNHRCLARASAALGTENYEASWREGLGLPVESLQALALRVTGATTTGS